MKGVLLINLGTPDDTSIKSIRRYLREFLLDPRVIDLPAPLRYLLVYGVILPFRSPKTAKAYHKIWQTDGSPLRLYSEKLATGVQQALGNDYQVALGMRYGNPSIHDALKQLKHCDELIILPLFPQYSSAATGSGIEKALTEVSGCWNLPQIKVMNTFYDRPEFIKSYAELIQPYIKNPDSFLLLSYHGLPERHLDKSECQAKCDRRGACPSMSQNNAFCYRAQCYRTSELIMQTLGLDQARYMTSFQSRLGRIPWIKPYTDEVLVELSQKGIKHLVIACPAFVADCLETLEEIGMQAREQWQSLGGENFTLVPCLNDHPSWVEGVVGLIQAT